ncbi:MAG: DHA2 family efflux MFS transporter permease subunit [Gemmatimonadetes bacterium]|nr:DHA2 family efflux MFS transporter permease subunit [Gemmatimonadota bacterium]
MAASAAAVALQPGEDAYRDRYIIAVTVTLASILELLDTSIVNVAIPHMMGTLGATLDQIAWVSTGYIVANVIVLPITGWLSSLFGRRRYFAGSIALFTLASFGCGNAHSLEALVFWRILQGLGGGALLSTSQAVLYEVFPKEEYTTAMAIFGMGVMVGPTLGPTLGGYITDAASWRWIFYINLPFGILALLLSLTYVRDSRWASKVQHVDWLGLLFLIAAVGSLQTMLERGEHLGWFESREIVAYAVTFAVAFVAFVWQELRAEHPVVDLSILRSVQFSAGLLFGALLGLCLYATVFVLPVYLQSILGFTAEQTGFVILPGALASAVTMAAMSRLRDRIDPRLLVVLGAGIFMASMWKHAHFTLDSGQDDFFWPLILRGVGLGLLFVPLNNLALAELPMHRIPNGTGLYNLTRQLGGSIGIAAAATLVTRFRTASRAALLPDISIYSEAARARIEQVSAGLLARGVPATEVHQRALALVDGGVTRQAMMLSFEKLFLLFGFAIALGLPLLLLMRKPIGAGISGDLH